MRNSFAGLIIFTPDFLEGKTAHEEYRALLAKRRAESNFKVGILRVNCGRDTIPEFMKDYFPDLFEKVKKYVKEGRWHVVGTCLDETDTLAPSVESMIRNVLYGDRWAKEEFGVSSNDIMIPDCFGFPANMPSIMAHCGINGFSSQKLTWNSAVGVPFDIGFWK